MSVRSVEDYLIDHAGFDWANLLSPWAWLLPKRVTVWLVNRFGDLFIVLDDETVHRLEIGEGTFEQLALNREDFRAHIDENTNAADWLMMGLVDELVHQKRVLKLGECYSYLKPPIIGGEYSTENTTILPIEGHLQLYGQFHYRIKDLPDGTPVESVWA